MADTEKKTEVAEAKADKPAKADKSVPAKKKDSFGKRTAKFFREYKSELKKVVWPTPKQTINNTVIVIVCVIVVGIFIWVFDALASSIIAALIDLFKG